MPRQPRPAHTKRIGRSRALVSSLGLAAALLSPSLAQGQVQMDELSLNDRMFYHRAVEAVVWAMPLLNFKQYREGHRAIGVQTNDVAYYSKVQDWKFQTATPNNTTPYINFFWNVKDGPVVVEIPASAEGVGIFGTLMDAWQRPIEDVGARGKDGGLGAKYLLVPPGYDGDVLAGALTYRQRTYNGFAILRPIIADASPENLAKAEAFAKQIKVYPLDQADDPPENRYVDIYGRLMEGTPILDGSIYRELHHILQEEVVEDQNLAMMGMLSHIDIRKGVPFEPDAETMEIYDAAARDALQYMIEQYHRHLNPRVYAGKRWSTLTPPGNRETEFTYEFPDRFDYHARGALYYAVISSVKNYGSATYYVDLAEDETGNWLDGGSTYKLVVPPNVPARDFWSVVVYDLETAAWIRDVPKVGLDSSMEDLVANPDGSVDIYFGPNAPDGKEGNWIPTREGRRFILLFRFYGPEPAALDGSWELNDVQRID
jgi:hypothetical protein